VRKFIPVLVLAALAIPAGSAFADDPDPPTLINPAPVAVSDTAAQNFAALVLRFRGGQLLLNNRRGRAENIDVVCRHPDNVARFLCVTRLDISLRTRSGFDRDRVHSARARIKHDDHHPPRPVQQDREIARFSCVAALRIDATRGRPFLQVLARDCVRVRNTNSPPTTPVPY